MNDNENRYSAFFNDNGDYFIKAHFYECTEAFTVEELYQAIKDRLLHEIKLSPEEAGLGD